jgi:hypothetical protein
MNLDDRVKMKIIPQISGRKNARRGQRAITKPTLLWCIEYENGGLFTFSYYRKLDAIQVIQRMKQYGTDTERYRQFNVVKNVDHTMHVFPKDE